VSVDGVGLGNGLRRVVRGSVGGLLLLHVAAVTAISVAFVVLGAAMRFGMPL
jgi:hypothetical protein